MNIKIKQSKTSVGLLMLAILILMCVGSRSTLISDSEVDFWSDNSRNPVNFGAIARFASFSVVITLSLILVYAYAKEKTENYWIPKMGGCLIEIPEEEPFKVLLQALGKETLFFRAEFANPKISTKNFLIEERFLDPLTRKLIEVLPLDKPIWVKYRVKYEIKDAGDDHEAVIPENVYFVYKDQNPELIDEKA